MKTLDELQDALRARLGVATVREEIVAAGVRTRFLVAGDAQSPPLVLVHGAGGGGVTFGPLIEPLANSFRLIIPDVVGYGASDKPDAPYDRAYFAKWLGAFVNELGISRASFIGHSQGGAIVARLSMDRPALVDKLVLIDPAGLAPLGSAGGGIIFAMILQNVHATRWSFRYPLGEDLRHYDDLLIDYHVAVARAPGGGRVFWNGRGRVVEPFTERELASIAARTLILWGERDRTFPFAAAERALASIRGAAHEVIAGAGHAPFLDAPDLVARKLRAFLDKGMPEDLGSPAAFPCSSE